MIKKQEGDRGLFDELNAYRLECGCWDSNPVAIGLGSTCFTGLIAAVVLKDALALNTVHKGVYWL